ncbi:hypothetical protein Dimus_039363 [Dionaea muscipula]
MPHTFDLTKNIMYEKERSHSSIGIQINRTNDATKVPMNPIHELKQIKRRENNENLRSIQLNQSLILQIFTFESKPQNSQLYVSIKRNKKNKESEEGKKRERERESTSNSKELLHFGGRRTT